MADVDYTKDQFGRPLLDPDEERRKVALACASRLGNATFDWTIAAAKRYEAYLKDGM